MFLNLRLMPFLPLLLAATVHAQAPIDAGAKAAVIAPFLDEQTLAVGRLDLQRIDAAAVAKVLAEVVPDKDPQVLKQLAAVEQKGKEVLHVLTQAGISELYLVFSLADLPKEPMFVVAPVKASHDGQKAADILRELVRMEATDVRPGLVVAGTTKVIERLKTVHPTPRPEFAKGFAKSGDAAAQLIFSPSADTRRVLREMLPRLPDEIGGGSGKTFVDGLQWGVLNIDAPPRLAFSLTIQSKDADAAAALRGTIVSGLNLLRAKGAERVPKLDEVIRVLTPQVKGDQLVIATSDQGGQAQLLLNLLLPAVQATRTSAGRAQSANNLKQIALAIHNYHDTYGRMPPQAIRGKDGKALLSWRVAILPYLGEEALYKQFRLDEPWDSEHNKALIGRMPPSLASPHLGDEVRAKGMTSYVVPLSKGPPAVALAKNEPGAAAANKAETVFDDPQGTKFARIVDGTSNTIMVVEANPKSAVVWTKPDDLVMSESDLFQDLRGQPNDGFNTAMCDGSVRFLKNSLDPATFLRLLQMNDGQPVGEF